MYSIMNSKKKIADTHTHIHKIRNTRTRTQMEQKFQNKEKKQLNFCDNQRNK